MLSHLPPKLKLQHCSLMQEQHSPLRVALEEMGHKQPATKLITDNSTADGILHGTIKKTRSKGIAMRYYWLRDRVTQVQFNVQWEPGKLNLADYFTKHHPPAHHQALRPVYLFDPNCIPDLQGCINILGSRATGKLAATRTSPVTKSGAKSRSGTKTGSKSGSNSRPNYSRRSKSGINHRTFR
jgi:hypothetical protein